MKTSTKKEWESFLSMVSVSVIAALFGFGYFWVIQLMHHNVMFSILAGMLGSGMLGYMLRGGRK